MRHFVVSLDQRYYKFVSDLDERFPQGAPSLANCTRFEVNGDFYFGRDVVCYGEVQLTNETDDPRFVGDGAVLSDDFQVGDNSHTGLLLAISH